MPPTNQNASPSAGPSTNDTSHNRRSTLDKYHEWLNESSSSSEQSRSGKQDFKGRDNNNSENQRSQQPSPSSVTSATDFTDATSANRNQLSLPPVNISSATATASPLSRSSIPPPIPPRTPSAASTPASTPKKPQPHSRFKSPKPPTIPSIGSLGWHGRSKATSPQPSSRSASSMSPSRLLSKPRRLMQHITSPRYYSPTPSKQRRPSPPHTRRPSSVRRKSSDRGMDTLYGTSWITQPHQNIVPKAAEKQQFYTVSLDEGDGDREKPQERASGRRSYQWEYNVRDSNTGWAIVAWAFLACFVSLSALFSYPVYDAYYRSTTQNSLHWQGDPLVLANPHRGQDRFHVWRFSYRATTYSVLIGTLLHSFALLAALPAGLVTDYRGARMSCMTGTVVLAVGLLTASFTDRLWVLCILQGTLGGIGAGLLFAPAYTIPMQWFDRHQLLATALAVCGSAIGTLGLSAAYHTLLHNHGLATSLRVQALITFVLGGLASWGLRPRVQIMRPPPLPFSARNLRVLISLLMLLVFFASAAHCIQILCLPELARVAGDVEQDGTNVLYAIAAAVLGGALVGPMLGDRLAAWPVIGICELLTAVLTFALWLPAKSLAPVYVYAVFTGLSLGTLIAGLPATTERIFGQARLPTIIGMALAAGCPAVLITTPLVIKFTSQLDEMGTTSSLAAAGPAAAAAFSLVAAGIGFVLPYLHRRQTSSSTFS